MKRNPIEVEPVKTHEAFTAALQKVIRESPAAIQAEFTKDYKGAMSNPWFACFRTRLSVIAILLASCDGKQAYPLYDVPIQEIKKLKIKVAALEQEAYGAIQHYGWNPPDEVRAQFLEKLQQFAAE